MSASRFTYIGGLWRHLNLPRPGASCRIPVQGYQAHAWIMSFPSRLEGFPRLCPDLPRHLRFARRHRHPQSGVPSTSLGGSELARSGHRLAGIRLDSGDLAALSQGARHLGKPAFHDARIVASATSTRLFWSRRCASKAPASTFGRPELSS